MQQKFVWLLVNVYLSFSAKNKYQIGDLATLYDLIPESTQNVLIENEEEVLSWQPYGNIDNSLLDPTSARMQRKWNEWNSYITTNGNIDSARLLISFGLLPILSSIGNDLHKFVTLNDTEKVIDLLTNPSYIHPIDIDSEKEDGSTSLIIATIMGYTKMVEILLKEGAYTESRSSSGATPLHFAAALNHSEIVSLLLKYNADCNTKHLFASSTPIHFAVEMNHANIVKLLCKSSKCNVEAKKNHGGSSIHIATEANCKESLIVLIKDCNVNLESKLLNDTTALYLAAQYGLNDIIKILIKYGANIDPVMPTISRNDIISYNINNNKYGSPNIPNPDYDGLYYPDKNQEIGNGATPLHAATENGHYQTVKLLLKYGAKQLGTMEGTNPIYIGIQYNQYQITKLLLKYDSSKSNINHQIPSNGHSSLYLAVGQNKFKFVKLLLKYGANINIQTKSGITPIYYSCIRRNDKILKELLKYVKNKNDLKIYINNDDKSNALHASAHYSCFKCIDQLIQFDPLLLLTNTNDNQNIFHYLFSKSINTQKSIKFIKKLLNIAVKNNINITNLINQKSKKYGLSPFLIAIQSNINIEIIKLLHQKYNADLNITANHNEYYSATPLFIAVSNNNTEIVQYLIKNNANCNAKLSERDHITPLFAAADKGYKDIVKLLLYKCNNLKLTSKEDENEDGLNINQYTPIHISCINGHNEIVKLFINYGITISIMDNKYDTDSIRELKLNEVDVFCTRIHQKQQQQQQQQLKKEL